MLSNIMYGIVLSDPFPLLWVVVVNVVVVDLQIDFEIDSNFRPAYCFQEVVLALGIYVLFVDFQN